jgi:hypothetical protein
MRLASSREERGISEGDANAVAVVGGYSCRVRQNPVRPVEPYIDVLCGISLGRFQ